MWQGVGFYIALCLYSIPVGFHSGHIASIPKHILDPRRQLQTTDEMRCTCRLSRYSQILLSTQPPTHTHTHTCTHTHTHTHTHQGGWAATLHPRYFRQTSTLHQLQPNSRWTSVIPATIWPDLLPSLPPSLLTVSQVTRLRDIYTAPSGLESTSLVLACGLGECGDHLGWVCAEIATL